MQKNKGLGSAKRFGARYGRRVKHRLAEIEREQRKKHLCPYCRAPKVKRLAVGIWQCGKCKAKFTGKAYSITKKVVVRSESAKQPADEPSIDEQPDEQPEQPVKKPEEQPTEGAE
ncbi:MAG: 50S ribosomal protein L37ae [Nanoarchaeota archaeon]|nr:50S ribosomal protein L37ae [Nanoarchaeota archaeon]